MKLKKYFGIALIIITLIVIVYFSNQPIEISRNQTRYAKRLILSIIGEDSGIRNLSFGIGLRNLAHLFLYGVLGFLVALVQRGFGWKIVFYSLLGVLIFALLDEFHQSFVPGRGAELKDVGTDLMGGTIGIAFAGVLKKVFRRDKKN